MIQRQVLTLISLVHMPLVSHHRQSVTQTVRWGSIEVQERSSQQRVCCCMDQEAEAWIKVSSLWDPKGHRWGEDRTPKNKEHTELTHQADCPAVVTMIHIGPPFCWLTGFRLQLTNPPFLYFFYSQGPKYSATLNFGINTKLNLHRA